MKRPTYEPELKDNMALLSYDSEGFRFLFAYDGEETLYPNELDVRKNRLVKV